MTREEKLETLTYWQEFAQTVKPLFDALNMTLGSTPECPIISEYWRLYTDYTGLIADLIGDHGEWLEWYAWENDFGSNGMPAGFDGKLSPVKTLGQLLMLIDEQNDRRTEVDPENMPTTNTAGWKFDHVATNGEPV